MSRLAAPGRLRTVGAPAVGFSAGGGTTTSERRVVLRGAPPGEGGLCWCGMAPRVLQRCFGWVLGLSCYTLPNL